MYVLKRYKKNSKNFSWTRVWTQAIKSFSFITHNMQNKTANIRRQTSPSTTIFKLNEWNCEKKNYEWHEYAMSTRYKIHSVYKLVFVNECQTVGKV